MGISISTLFHVPSSEEKLRKEEEQLRKKEIRAMQEKAIYDSVVGVLSNIHITFAHCFIIECAFEGHQIFAVKADPTREPFFISKTIQVTQDCWPPFVESLKPARTTVKPTGLYQYTVTTTKSFYDLKAVRFLTTQMCKPWIDASLSSAIFSPLCGMNKEYLKNFLTKHKFESNDQSFKRAAGRVLEGFSNYEGLIRNSSSYFKRNPLTTAQASFQLRLKSVVCQVFKNFKELQHFRKVIEFLDNDRPVSPESPIIDIATKYAVEKINEFPSGSNNFDSFFRAFTKSLKDLPELRKEVATRPKSDFYE
ncbi:MAG: hypothetical protein ACSNEK_04450 [Parachlamydiaceae bacterium]